MWFTKPFPLRVVPFEDESLLGFVGRLMARNAYPRQKELWKSLGMTKSRTDKVVLERLKLVSDIAVEELSGLFDHQPHGDFVRMCGHSLHRLKIATEPSICLQCFAEHGYHRAIWDITWYAACPRHGCLLTAACPTCKMVLTWDRHRFLECPSRHRLDGMSDVSHPVDGGTRAEVAIEEIVRFGEVRSERLPQEIAELPLDAFLDVLNVLGGFNTRGYTEAPKVVRPNSFARVSARMNRGLFEATAWPTSLHQFIRRQSSRRNTKALGLGNLEFEIRSLANSPAGKLLARGWMQERSLPSETSSDRDEVTLEEAAARMGYSHSEMLLVDRVDGLAEADNQLPLHRRFISGPKFVQWVSSGRAWITLQNLASRWKVPRVSLSDVCREGVMGFDVGVQTYMHGPWRVRQSEVDGVEELLSAPRKKPVGPALPFSELGLPVGELITAVRMGKLVACDWHPEQGIGEALFAEPEGPTHTVPKTPATPAMIAPRVKGLRIALRQVSKELGIELVLLQKAYFREFFGPVQLGTDAIDVDVAAVTHFAAKYVSPFRLFKEERIPTREHVYQALRYSSVRPVMELSACRGGWHLSRFYSRRALSGIKFV